ncbi:MAG: DNA internalization-related competence protein ComEC/Rec2 [Pseudohongiellaceae bacterium]
MRVFLLAYSAGIILVGFLPVLQLVYAMLALLIAVVCVVLLIRSSGSRSRLQWLAITNLTSTAVVALVALAALATGALWHLHWAAGLLDKRLPTELEGADLPVQGYVASLPDNKSELSRFVFITNSNDSILPGRKLLLTAYDEQIVRGGQCLSLTARLRRPHGTANPGTLDYEAWLARNQIHGIGYLVGEPVPANTCASVHPAIALTRLRQQLASMFQRSVAELDNPGLVMALVLGTQSAVTPEQWDTFNATGTTHLFVVSGLHVGLVAGFVFVLLRLLWTLSPWLSHRLPAQQAAALGGLLAAFGYGAISGFGLPAQRALIMLACVLASHLGGVSLAASLRLLVAAALVLSINPLSATGAGFWLSFIAVAALLSQTWGQARGEARSQTRGDASTNPARSVWHPLQIAQNLLLPQWRIAVALAVPLLFWTQSMSLLAPLVNLLAIPLMGLLVLPLSLLALCLAAWAPWVSTVLLTLADWCLGMLLQGLTVVYSHSALSFLQLNEFLSPLSFIYATVVALLLLAPRYLFSRLLVPLLALLLLLPVVMPKDKAELPAGVTLELHVLDVGQGTAVIVRSADKWLVYDAGPALLSGFNTGSAIVVPVLRQLGAQRLDALIISHDDTDHSGGTSELLRVIPADKVYSGDDLPFLNTAAMPCHTAQQWRWGEITFRFLHPPSKNHDYGEGNHEGSNEGSGEGSGENSSEGSGESKNYIGNDRSCVLQISAADFSVLLPGDISTQVERELVIRYREQLATTVLLTPHHGSTTSSGMTFLKWVAPSHTIHSAGYRNRFGHPSPEVTARYQTLNTSQYLTHATGRLRIRFRPGQPPEVQRYRDSYRRYWHSR